MKKRMLAIMMSALMAAGICSGVTVYADADSKTLTVGFDAEYPPFGYMDESGEYVGFDLDVAQKVNKLEQPAPNLMDLILGHKIDVVIDTPPQGVEHQKDGFVIRRNAIETGVNVLTSLDTAEALVTSLENTDLHNLTLIDIATIASR